MLFTIRRTVRVTNNIYLIVGESGSGKTSICDYLSEHYELKQVESYTTRPPRHPNEKGHIFVSESEFDKLRDDMVAYTKFDRYEYCATSEQVDNSDLYTIDPRGVKEFMELYKGEKSPKIIFIDTSLNIRFERMVSRADEDGFEHADSVDMALDRIVNDVEAFYEMRHNNMKQADIVITNDDTVKSSAEKVYAYIQGAEADVLAGE